MKCLLIISVALAPLTALTAQEEAPQNPGQKEYQTLTGEYLEAQRAYARARSAIIESEKFQRLENPTAQQKLLARVKAPDIRGFVTKFKAAAERHTGQDEQALFLSWIATKSTKKLEVCNAADALLQNHIESEHLLEFATQLEFMGARLGNETFDEIVEALAELNPYPKIQAQARFSRAMAKLNAANAENTEARIEAFEELALVSDLVPDTELAMRAAAPEFEATQLQIGMPAPDIQGEDLDGVPFGLSDYRGKVVVLDFWGDW